MSDPVTVAITRHLDAGHEAEMVSWLQAGMALAVLGWPYPFNCRRRHWFHV